MNVRFLKMWKAKSVFIWIIGLGLFSGGCQLSPFVKMKSYEWEKNEPPRIPPMESRVAVTPAQKSLLENAGVPTTDFSSDLKIPRTALSRAASLQTVIANTTASQLVQSLLRPQPDERLERMEALKAVQPWFDENSRRARVVLKDLSKQGDEYGKFRLGVTAVGLAAATAAAALAAASPANIVWFTALTGVSAGVIGFQSDANAQGMSRDSIIQVHGRLQVLADDASKNFAGFLAACYSKVGESDSDFYEAYGKVLLQGYIMFSIAHFQPMNIGITDTAQIETLKTNNEYLRSEIKRLQGELQGAPGTSTPGTSTPGTSTPGTSTPGTSTPGT